MTLHEIALAIHIAFGTLALAAFWAAGLLRKGTPRHRLAGRVFLLVMLGVIASGFLLVRGMIDRGQPIGGLFLGYLLILVGNTCWSGWRAVRDRGNRAAYFGPTYWLLAATTTLSGLGIVLLGLQIGQPLFVVFGAVGVFAGIGAVRSWQRAPGDPAWWRREHYGAMIGNGIATHIAFFGVGLRNAFPGLDPTLTQNLAWFLPLAVGTLAILLLDRRHARGLPVPARGEAGSSQAA